MKNGWVRVTGGQNWCHQHLGWFRRGWKFYVDAITATRGMCDSCAEEVTA